MDIKTAIEKAIEGGYENTEEYVLKARSILGWNDGIFLDPQFWQALGKSMGWGEADHYFKIPMWLHQWHKLIDTLAEGKSIEDFFAQLDD